MTRVIHGHPLGLAVLSLSLPWAVHIRHAVALPECSASVPHVLGHSGHGERSGFGTCDLPVDDTVDGANPAEYSPWTHPPICEVSTADYETKYCVYTNSRHGRRGLSVLATPDVAADTAGLLLLEASPGVSSAGNRTTGSGNDENGDEGPFKIVDIPGKGKGVVATRRIGQYEQIMLDYSVLLVDVSFTAEVPRRRGYRLLHAAVERLRDPECVMGLERTNDLAQDHIENVLRTNGFQSVLSDRRHIALYPLVSRINHACKPNAYTRFNPENLQLASVAAARDIEAGEEITISYITLGKPTQERQRLLKTWGFECTCSLCTSPPEIRAASDARRQKIEDLRDRAVSAFRTGRTYEMLRLTRQVLALLPPEELFPMYAEQYENMARAYYVLRDHDKAVEFADKSLRVLVEQGFLDRIGPSHLVTMWETFAADEAARF